MRSHPRRPTWPFVPSGGDIGSIEGKRRPLLLLGAEQRHLGLQLLELRLAACAFGHVRGDLGRGWVSHGQTRAAQPLQDRSDSKAWLMSSSNSSQTVRTCFMTRQAFT